VGTDEKTIISRVVECETHGEEEFDSNAYTLADFYELDDEDLFAKTVPAYRYIQHFEGTGCFTYARPLVGPCGNRSLVEDRRTGRRKRMIMMASNNYLGLTTHPRVVEAGQKALEKYGSGGSSAPFLSGTFDITKKLEGKLAELKGCGDAMVFSSGYSANLGTISALLRHRDVAIVDKLDHASIVDGCRLSGAAMRSYRHGDVAGLEKILRACDGKYMGKLVITDGVFGMDGDLCPLPEIKKVVDMYGAKLMLDDAHATGVVGKRGRGTAEYFNMEGEIDLVIGTFSKTLGAIGAFVASTEEVINYIRLYARSYFFSAALPPAVCASVIAALEVLEEEPWRVARLRWNVKHLHDRLTDLGLEVTPAGTGVVSVIIGEELLVRRMSKRIDELGLYINPLPSPSVPKGQERFKFSLMATHSEDDVDEAADIFEMVCREFGVL
jgi:8-amino-7-oxononanoate synthase